MADELRKLLRWEVTEKPSPELLSAASRCCALNEYDEAASIIQSARDEDLMRLVNTLLALSVKGLETGNLDVPWSRAAIRCLVNAANRSNKLKEVGGKAAASRESLQRFRALLRTPELRQETYAALIAFYNDIRKESRLEEEFALLVGEVAFLWEREDEETRSWSSAFFSLLVEDASFLCDVFHDCDEKEMSATLKVVEVLLDKSDHGASFHVHENNIRFVVRLLERILFELGEDEEKRKNKADETIEQVVHLVSIIGHAAQRRDDFPFLHSDSTALSLVVAVLEALYSVDVTRWVPSAESSPGRPAPIAPLHRNAPQKDARVRSLASLLSRESDEALSAAKCSSIASIGNLCCESPENQRRASELDTVLLVLLQARRNDHSPFIMQYAISTLRHLCHGSPENQAQVLRIDEKPTDMIDRKKLLAELGILVESRGHSTG